MPFEPTDIKRKLATLKQLREDGLLSEKQYDDAVQKALSSVIDATTASTRQDENASPENHGTKDLSANSTINHPSFSNSSTPAPSSPSTPATQASTAIPSRLLRLAAWFTFSIFLLSFALPAYLHGPKDDWLTSEYRGYEAALFTLTDLKFRIDPLTFVATWPTNILFCVAFYIVLRGRAAQSSWVRWVCVYAVGGQLFWNTTEAVERGSWLVGYWIWLASGVSLCVLVLLSIPRPLGLAGEAGGSK